MKFNRYLTAVFFVSIFLAIGCGGAEKKSTKDQMLDEVNDDVDVVAELTGIDETTPVAVEQETPKEKPAEVAPQPAEQPVDDNIGGTQGAFVAKMLIEGKETPGTFTVNETVGDGAVVMKDVPVGQEISLAPGDYDFTFVPAEVVGNPKQTLVNVGIPAGKRIRREVKIPVGRITLVPAGGGCSKRPIRIKLKGASDWYPGKFTTCEELVLMAGEYEGEMGSGKQGTPISGIKVYEGGIQNVTIRPK